MRKSILVIDTPETCRECPCGKEINNHYCIRYECSVLVQNMTKQEYKKEKPDWCPLKEFPQKMVEENRWFSDEYAQGYNACIENIIKGIDK